MEDFEKITSFIIRHNLRFRDFNTDELGWTIGKSEISGKGVIATKCYQPGDIIFIDYPMVVGPRSYPNLPLVCVVCYCVENLRSCSRNCSLPVCSALCENDERHNFECFYLSGLISKSTSNAANRNLELVKSVTPIRCLKFDKLSKDIINHHLHKINGPQQGFEVGTGNMLLSRYPVSK